MKENNDIEHIIKFCADVLYADIAAKKEEEQALKMAEAAAEESDDEDDFFSSRLSKTPSKAFQNFIDTVSMMDDDEINREMENVKLVCMLTMQRTDSTGRTTHPRTYDSVHRRQAWHVYSFETLFKR